MAVDLLNDALLCRHTGLTVAERFALVICAWRADAKGYVTMSASYLAGELGCTERYAHRIRDRLVELGYMKSAGRRCRTNRYRLNPELWTRVRGPGSMVHEPETMVNSDANPELWTMVSLNQGSDSTTVRHTTRARGDARSASAGAVACRTPDTIARGPFNEQEAETHRVSLLPARAAYAVTPEGFVLIELAMPDGSIERWPASLNGEAPA